MDGGPYMGADNVGKQGLHSTQQALHLCIITYITYVETGLGPIAVYSHDSSKMQVDADMGQQSLQQHTKSVNPSALLTAVPLHLVSWQHSHVSRSRYVRNQSLQQHTTSIIPSKF